MGSRDLFATWIEVGRGRNAGLRVGASRDAAGARYFNSNAVENEYARVVLPTGSVCPDTETFLSHHRARSVRAVLGSPCTCM